MWLFSYIYVWLIDVHLFGKCFDLVTLPDDICSQNPGKTYTSKDGKEDSGIWITLLYKHIPSFLVLSNLLFNLISCYKPAVSEDVILFIIINMYSTSI